MGYTATILAGQTYVDVVHSLGFVPDAADIYAMAQAGDDLGGRTLTIDTCTATTFRINISSIDTGDHIIVAFYNGAPALSVGYTTVALVKALLRITDSTHDLEVATAIGDGDRGFIDAVLMLYTQSLPLLNVPTIISVVSKYFAAATYLRLMPTSDVSFKQADAYEAMARNMFDEYVRRKYYQGRAFSN